MPLISELGKFCPQRKNRWPNFHLVKAVSKVVSAICVVAVISILHFRFPKRHVLHHPISSSRSMLYVINNGRLGNQMFQYASLIGLAKTNNMTPVIHAESDLWDAFKISGEAGYESDLANAVVFQDDRAGIFVRELTALSESTIIHSYVQSYKYFENVRTEISQKHFVFKDSIQRSAKDYIARALREKGRPLAKVVGMHVRRGDFVRKRRLGYTVAPRPYLYRSMNYFQRKYSDVVFIVASDDIDWCRKNVVGPYTIHFAQTQNSTMDMAVLVNCDDVIITTGSFSWWIGYLNKGVTVYYKDYPAAGTWLGSIYAKEDYYPPEWIPL